MAARNRFVLRVLTLLFAVCSGVLLLGASYALRLRCEAFGCPNSAALWSAWSLVYALTLALGLRLRTGLVPRSRSRAVATAVLMVLVAAGLALAARALLPALT